MTAHIITIFYASVLARATTMMIKFIPWPTNPDEEDEESRWEGEGGLVPDED